MQSRIRFIVWGSAALILLGALLWQRTSYQLKVHYLQKQIDQLEQQLADRRSAVPQPPPPSVSLVPPSAPLAAHPADSPAIHQKETQIVKLQEELAVARARVSELETNVLSLQSDRATLSQQRITDLKAAEETCRNGAADLQAALNNAQAQVKIAQQKSATLEQENANLRRAQAELAKSVVRPAAAAGELDEISKRREAYLKNLIRRYREIENEYRAMINSAGAQRDPSHANDAAALRIQTLLSQAEDDLRQIDALNAKSLLVEKKQNAQ